MKQTSFFKSSPLSHGGDLARGKRKRMRPFDPKRPAHVVMHSSRARGPWSLLKHKVLVIWHLNEISERFGIKLIKETNLGSHLHLIIKAPSRRAFQNWLRLLAGTIALHITRAKKGSPKGKFWDELAFTRVVAWGRDLLGLRAYLSKNEIEALQSWKPGMRLTPVEIMRP